MQEHALGLDLGAGRAPVYGGIHSARSEPLRPSFLIRKSDTETLDEGARISATYWAALADDLVLVFPLVNEE